MLKHHVSLQNCLHTSTILAGKAGCIIALHFVLPTAVLTLVFWATQQFRFGVGNVQPVLWVPRQLCTILHGSMQLDDYLVCAKCCLATSTGER